MVKNTQSHIIEEYAQLMHLQELILAASMESGNAQEVVAKLCRLAESLLPQSVATVLLRNSAGTLDVFMAPNLPPDAQKQLIGLQPDPDAVTCGNAVWCQEPVYVVDTLTDQRWNKLRHLAIDFNIMACWSMPIFDRDNKALGIFTLSSFVRRSPNAFHEKLMKIVAQAISIVLEQHRLAAQAILDFKILESISEGALITDASQHVLYVNPAFTRITGYSLDEMQGKNCNVLQGLGTGNQTRTDIRAALMAGQPYHGRILNYRKGGAPFWNELTINPLRNSDGIITHFVGVQRDISARKAMEAELAIRQDLLTINNEQELYQRVTDALIKETDAIGVYIAVTEPDIEWFKIEAASADKDDLRTELLTLTPSRDPENIPYGMMLPSRAYREKRPIGPVNPQDNISMRSIQVKYPVLDRIQAVMAFPVLIPEEEFPAAILVVDGASAQHFTEPVCQLLTQVSITLGVALTQLRQRHTVSEAAAFNTALVDTIGAIVMVIDRDGEIVRMNRISEQFMGIAFEEAKGKPYFWERFIPEDERAHVHHLFEMMHQHTLPPENENHWVNRFGEKRLFHWINTILDDDEGQAKYMITLGMDITDQKRLERNLQAESAKNHALLQHASDGIHIVDERGYLLEASQQFCTMLGYSCDEMLGMHVSQWEAKFNKDELDALIHQKVTSTAVMHFETQHRRKDGSVFDVELSSNMIEIAGKNVLFVSVRDITERKAQENILQQNTVRLQRLSDFNALLAEVNQTIVVARDDRQLLQEICEMSVRYAHFELATIAIPNASGRFEYPVAAGKTNFLDEMRRLNLLASLDPDIPEGRSAYASVWREGRPRFIGEALSASFAKPWHELFRRGGVHSYAVLPVFRQQRIFGIFALYHSEKNIFDQDVTDNLSELARDISRGLDRLDLMHQERASATFNEALLNSMAVGISIMRYPERIIEQVNPRMLEIYGAASKEDMIGLSAQEFYSDTETLQKVGEFAQTVLAKGSGMLHDVPYQRLDGAVIYIDLSGQKLAKSKDEPERIVWTHVDVTERHRNEETILRLNTAKEALLSNTATGIDMVQYPERIVLEANRGFLNLLGYEDIWEIIGQSTQKIYPSHESDEIMRQLSEEILLHGSGSVKNIAIKRKDGGIVYLDVSGQLLQGESTDHPTIVWTSMDVTERKQAEDKLRLAASVFTNAGEGIMITTTDGTIIDVNVALTRITGYTHDELIGQNPRIFSSGHQDKQFYADLWHDLKEHGYWHGELMNRRKNGEVYPQKATISAVRDEQGNTLQYMSLFFDITEIKENERQLEHMAHYDVLTNLPNRMLLTDRLQQAMMQTHRRGQQMAVAYLDLDGFKAVNDQYGHEAGDQLLIILSTRMKQVLREGDTFARLGGDEFVAVLSDLDSIETNIVPTLTRLLSAAAQPVHNGDDLLQVSASVGVTFYPQGEDIDADQLLRQADQAMYQAKLSGKNRYHFFDTKQDINIRSHHESLERIRHALIEHEFVLYYQPKVNMRTGAIIGAEALIRWQHPEKGLLPPAAFLPVIENNSLFVDVGEWVIDTALTQIETWHATGLNVPVSVNVGALQLQQADFVARLQTALAAHPNVQPGDLELEVLETSALEDLAHVSRIIEDCRKIGILFSLDDFGTGYSSLTYLKHLQAGTLKIDQSFVRDMLGASGDLAILDGVIGLAAAFRRKVIAEGVETIEHGELLLQLGCELAQGYGIARPMPAQNLPAWAATWYPDPAWVGKTAVSRDSLPLLFADIEHRAWVADVESFLKGQRETPPPLNHHQCQFGMWLDDESKRNPARQPILQAIESMHRQVHALARDLLEHQSQGRTPEALAMLHEFHGLSKNLLQQLKMLLLTLEKKITVSH